MPFRSRIPRGKSVIFHRIFPGRYRIFPSFYRIFSEEKVKRIWGGNPVLSLRIGSGGRAGGRGGVEGCDLSRENSMWIGDGLRGKVLAL